MTITREQVADLQPGDVVEIRLDEWETGQAIRGPISLSETHAGVLEVRIPGGDGRYWVRGSGGLPFDPENRTLTVVSRAPRPLYVNHPRTEPVPGDVASPAHGRTGEARPNHAGRLVWWRWAPASRSFLYTDHAEFEREGPLRLLVDGETGQVVA